MAVTATCKIYNGVTFTPQEYSLFMERAASVTSGLLYGCGVTLSGTSTLNVASGWAVIHARVIQVTAGSIAVTLPTSGTLDGQIYIKLDLSNTTTPTEVIVETGTLTELTDDDNFNIVSGVAYLKLATFSVSASTVSDLTMTATEISGISETVTEAIEQIEAAAATALGVTHYDSGRIGFLTSINASNTIRLHLHKMGSLVLGELHIKAAVSNGANNGNYGGTITEVSIPEGFRPAHLNRFVTASITNAQMPTNYTTCVTCNTDGTMHWTSRYPYYTERYFSLCWYTED